MLLTSARDSRYEHVWRVGLVNGLSPSNRCCLTSVFQLDSNVSVEFLCGTLSRSESQDLPLRCHALIPLRHRLRRSGLMMSLLLGLPCGHPEQL